MKKGDKIVKEEVTFPIITNIRLRLLSFKRRKTTRL